jgi:hypothetical protein
VKRLPWISISCFENTVGESSGILLGLFLEFGDFGISELFLLSLKWLLKQGDHLEIFA